MDVVGNFEVGELLKSLQPLSDFYFEHIVFDGVTITLG